MCTTKHGKVRPWSSRKMILDENMDLHKELKIAEMVTLEVNTSFFIII